MPTPFSFIDWKLTPVIVGTLCGKLAGVGSWKKAVFALKTDTGEVLHTWAFMQLRNELMHAPFGTKYRITFEGDDKDEETGFTAKIFKVEILELAVVTGKKKKGGKPTGEAKESAA